MPLLQSLLQRVKQRQQSSIAVRAIKRGCVLSWKAARAFPGSRYLRIQMTADGHRFWVRPFSYDDLLTVSPDYESLLNRWRPQSGDTVVDAGAFIGRHTMAYAREVGPSGRVIAIEPHPENFRLLLRNVRQNGYRNVTCVRCALSDYSGEGRLAYDRETSTGALSPGKARSVAVRVRTLDDLLSELQVPQVDLMKVDVEGAELDLLRGATVTLGKGRQPQLIIENHDEPPGDDRSGGLLLPWLDAHGFHSEAVSDGGRHFFVTNRFVPKSDAITDPTPPISSHSS